MYTVDVQAVKISWREIFYQQQQNLVQRERERESFHCHQSSESNSQQGEVWQNEGGEHGD